MDAQAQNYRSLDLRSAARLDGAAVLARLASSDQGLSAEAAVARLREVGANAIRSHGAQVFDVLLRQIRSPLLILLAAAAATSFGVGERTDALMIFAIMTLSVGLGFLNEYRAERAVEALHSRIRHIAVTLRDGRAVPVNVTELVPGDIVRLDIGDVVPADLRLTEANGLECDEAVLTGEATPAEKQIAPVAATESPLALPSCAFMGTVVHAGTGRGVVVRTGGDTAFGAIAMRLGTRPPQTAFQLGLRDFSVLLVQVTAVLTISIFVINTALRRPILESALFALAVAVGLTPQLLPAIVTVSLSTGARRLARKSVVVKRLVSIEDLGNIQVLFTDKTGTLTEGRITYRAALGLDGMPSEDVLRLGLECSAAVVEAGVVVGGNPLDGALWEANERVGAEVARVERLAEVPFDYERRLMSVLVKDAQGLSTIGSADERDLTLAGLLVFDDRPKAGVGESLKRLGRLGIEVKIVTGDNDRVAVKLCRDLGIAVAGTLTGDAIEAMSDEALAAALPTTTIFARVTPDQKSRIIRAQRRLGADVAFLGDGVNDAVALHDADVGISVDSAADVAKDAADIVLLAKDLDILADGVVEGRRIFSNTIKYVLMGTSSNFGNMFSAAGASLVLSFLPMLPPQILLNNLLYDVSEMTIPSDHVDEELLQRPAHWDTGFIRRFMLFFGPISSLYDFMTFGVMIWVFNAGETLFHSAWFVESLATQALVIFVIRTRRVPFFRSRPSLPLAITSLACVAIGAALPFSPLADVLGFRALPVGFLAILVVMVVTYLGLVEVGKARFFRAAPPEKPLARPRGPRERRMHRVAARWSRKTIEAGRS